MNKERKKKKEKKEKENHVTGCQKIKREKNKAKAKK